MNYNKLFLFIAAHIVAMFSLWIAFSLLNEYLIHAGVFDDMRCTGVYETCNKSGMTTDHYVGAIHWGTRHWLYQSMCWTLAALSVIFSFIRCFNYGDKMLEESK